MQSLSSFSSSSFLQALQPLPQTLRRSTSSGDRSSFQRQQQAQPQLYYRPKSSRLSRESLRHLNVAQIRLDHYASFTSTSSSTHHNHPHPPGTNTTSPHTTKEQEGGDTPSSSWITATHPLQNDDPVLPLLHGRESELQTVMDFLSQASNKNDNDNNKSQTNQSKPPSFSSSSRLLRISGESGVGKTSLVQTALLHYRQQQQEQPPQSKQQPPQPPLLAVWGKFALDFSQQPTLPYQGIAQACRHVCQVLLLHDQDDSSRQEQRRDELRRALGSSLSTLATVLPELMDFLNPNEDEEHHDTQPPQPVVPPPPTTTIRTQEAQNRLRHAFGRFVGTVTHWFPVVLVLDDLQWADVESIRGCQSHAGHQQQHHHSESQSPQSPPPVDDCGLLSKHYGTGWPLVGTRSKMQCPCHIHHEYPVVAIVAIVVDFDQPCPAHRAWQFDSRGDERDCGPCAQHARRGMDDFGIGSGGASKDVWQSLFCHYLPSILVRHQIVGL